MKTIIITGPSGSGKTELTVKLAKLFKNSIVIRTDSYYRDNLYIKLLSLFKYDIYDRILSIKKRSLTDTIKSIRNKEKNVYLHKYDFKEKRSSITLKNLKNENKYKMIIIEGIFAHRLNINYNDTLNIICSEKKRICYSRRIIRDKSERGRNEKEIKKKFNKSWYLFYKNLTNFLDEFNVIYINTNDKMKYKSLIMKINYFYTNKKTKEENFYPP
tara:strand:+ start:40 stop:684 length:645 start_codon:yes stop_codon:yes gene_type:complete